MQALGFRLMEKSTHLSPESVATALCLTADRYSVSCILVDLKFVFIDSVCFQITTNFNVWVLSTNKDGDSDQLPEIGGDDPSVYLFLYTYRYTL